MDEKDLDRQLEQFDLKVTPEYLLKLHKVKLAQRINAGETGLFEEFRRLRELEAAVAATAAPRPSSADAAPGGEDTPSAPETEDQRKARVLDRLHIRSRQYTMTEAALAQRKAAANSPGKARSMLGNKNAWKTGQHAQGFVRRLFRPCLSTCPQYPCELIDDGETVPGSVCMDKAEFVKGVHALQRALRTNDLDDYKELAAVPPWNGCPWPERTPGRLLLSSPVSSTTGTATGSVWPGAR